MNQFSVSVYDPKVYVLPVGKYEPQIKYLKAHPEKAKEIHARYLERHRDDYNNYHKLYERAKYEWNTYVHNNKYKYEKKLFLKILLED